MIRLSAAVLAALPLWVAPGFAQDTGAFFTLVNTYAFVDSPREGERHLLRARRSFTVVDFTVDAEDVVWYWVVQPERRVKISGTGWVALDPHELNQLNGQPVLVFPEVIEEGMRPMAGREVPAADLVLANVTQPSGSVPEITWQKVTYETEVPGRVWVRSTTGIYRPFRSAKIVADVHAEMVTRSVDNDRLRRLLSGVTRVGDSPQEVAWALGDPTQREESTAEELNIMVWHYPGLQVRFENSVVKQIN